MGSSEKDVSPIIIQTGFSLVVDLEYDADVGFVGVSQRGALLDHLADSSFWSHGSMKHCPV